MGLMCWHWRTWLVRVVYVRFKAQSNEEAVDHFRSYLTQWLPGYPDINALGSLYRVDGNLLEIDLDVPSREMLRLSRRKEIEAYLTMQIPTNDQITQALQDYAAFARHRFHRTEDEKKQYDNATGRLERAGEVLCMLSELVSLNNTVPDWIDIEVHSLESWIYSAPRVPCLPAIRNRSTQQPQALYLGEVHVHEVW